MSVDEQTLDRARQALAKAERITVMTGAGVSAESGVPTFRGADGLWRNHDVTRLATPQAFEADPALVWEFYNWRRELLSKVEPNPAHYALAGLERTGPEMTLITQNVDGLHRAAGSRDVVELHGNMWLNRCPACGFEEEDRRAHIPYPPLCPRCSALLRPGVVWFGESLDARVLDQAARAADRAGVMLVIGTSAVVYPAASLAPLAKRSGAVVIEVNLEPTPATAAVDFSLLGKAGQVVPRLLEDLIR